MAPQNILRGQKPWRPPRACPYLPTCVLGPLGQPGSTLRGGERERGREQGPMRLARPLQGEALRCNQHSPFALRVHFVSHQGTVTAIRSPGSPNRRGACLFRSPLPQTDTTTATKAPASPGSAPWQGRRAGEGLLAWPTPPGLGGERPVGLWGPRSRGPSPAPHQDALRGEPACDGGQAGAGSAPPHTRVSCPARPWSRGSAGAVLPPQAALWVRVRLQGAAPPPGLGCVMCTGATPWRRKAASRTELGCDHCLQTPSEPCESSSQVSEGLSCPQVCTCGAACDSGSGPPVPDPRVPVAAVLCPQAQGPAAGT